MGEPRCSSSAIPRNLEQADLGRSTPPLATLVYTETKMSTHKHSEAGNELRSLSMIRYDQSMNATTQRSKDSHFWHLTPLPAHRQVHTPHTPTSGSHIIIATVTVDLDSEYRFTHFLRSISSRSPAQLEARSTSLVETFSSRAELRGLSRFPPSSCRARAHISTYVTL